MGRLFEHKGARALGFDTGLDARAFARSKLADLVTETGLTVRLVDGAGARLEPWKPAGVIELASQGEGSRPTMTVWGPAVSGERLDQSLNAAAISLWLRALCALDDKARASLPLWPGAAFVCPNEQAVFFAPPTLALHCLRAAGDRGRLEGRDRYAHPDWNGERAIAFAGAAMAYRALAGFPPFSAENESLLHQDMREGNFLPIKFAAPGLDPALSETIQGALAPKGKRNSATGAIEEKPLPKDLVAALDGSAASLTRRLSDEESAALEKEKAQFLKLSAASVKTRRFLARNAGLLVACIAALIVAGFFLANFLGARASRPTTEGMSPAEVVERFYQAFGELDHDFMDAATLRGVAREDISSVINVFVVNRVRMAHEFGPAAFFMSASEWQEAGGGPTELTVFGVTDLRLTEASAARDPGARDPNIASFRADYLLWAPAPVFEATDDALPEGAALPASIGRRDILTLVYRQGMWRISEIERLERD